MILTRLFPERASRDLIARRKDFLLPAVEQTATRRGWTEGNVREHQARSLKALLVDAYENVPFYRDKYRSAGFTPSSFQDLDDLEKIPIVTKAELRNAGIGSLKNAASRGAVWLLSSSGSTGTPCRIYREEKSLWQFVARSMALYLDWCAGKPLGNALYFIDLAPGSIDFALADLLRTTVMESRIVSSARPTEELVEAIEKHCPEFISSYPSTMRNIAVAAHRRGMAWDGLRLLHLTSEMLDRCTRALLSKVFPRVRLVETYTSSEAGLIAHSCPQMTDCLHIAEDDVVLEIVDPDGDPKAKDGSGVGEVVVTDLTSRSTPIIRYCGLGDFASWTTMKCDCGFPFRSIRQLEGRLTDSIRLPNGGTLSPYTLIDSIEELAGIYQFQIVQASLTELIVRIVRDESAGHGEDDIRRSVEKSIDSVVSGAACRVEFVPAILPENGRHKVPLVISRLAAT